MTDGVTDGGVRFELAGAERVDQICDLWLALHRHHRGVVGSLPVVEDDELSWRRRRELYLSRLEPGTGFLALALEGDTVVGYALVCIEEGPDDTFLVGERYAELCCFRSHPRGAAAGSARSCSTSWTPSSTPAASAT